MFRISRHCARLWLSVAASVLFPANAAVAQFDSGSDGSDGAFHPLMNVEIDLSYATTASWDTPSPVPGLGVYDPDQWAVVFKYTTITIPEGVTVTFKNHPSGAPVMWLASGGVVIEGDVKLCGQAGHSSSEPAFYSQPGPGGFQGPIGVAGGQGGLGPGGANDVGSPSGSGSYSTAGYGSPAGAVYGNEMVLPLIGGSSGATAGPGAGAGAGGGAILIASTTEIILDGLLLCDSGLWSPSGGTGAGSGGAIRLRANTVRGSGDLRARGCTTTGPCGGEGRIRVEAHTNLLTHESDPPYSYAAQPGPVFPPADSPKLRATLVDGVDVPQYPIAGILTTDFTIDNDQLSTIDIEAENVPPGTYVNVRVVPARGDVIMTTSTPLVGTLEYSTATAQVQFPRGRSEIQLRAVWTP